MTKDEAIAHFGSQAALADALGIKPPSVAEWDAVPDLRQLQLEILTRGKLKADPELKRPGAKAA